MGNQADRSSTALVIAGAQIEALCRVYDQLADSHDVQLLSGLFIPAGEFERFGVRYKGRTAIQNLLESRPSGLKTRHTSSDFQFEVDTAGYVGTGVLNMHVLHWMEGAENDVETVLATFNDEYVLIEGQWKFSRRQAFTQTCIPA